MSDRHLSCLLLLAFVLVSPLNAQQVPEPANGATTTGVHQIIGAPTGILFARIDHDILASRDSGLSWYPLHLPVDNSVELLDIVTDGVRLWVATSDGVYGGGIIDGMVRDDAWERRNEQVHRRLHLTPEGRLLGYDPSARTVDRSIDGAGTWSTVEEGRDVQQFVTGSDGTLWMVSRDGVFTSDDDGLTWVRFSPGDDGEGISYLYPFDNGDVLALGATKVMQSRKGANEWIETGSMPPHGMVVTAGTYGPNSAFMMVLVPASNPIVTSFYISADTGRSWVETDPFINSEDLAIEAFYPRDDSTFLVGGTYHRRMDGIRVASFGQLVLAPTTFGLPGNASFSSSLQYSQISSIYLMPDSAIIAARFVHDHPNRVARELNDWIYRSGDEGGWWDPVSTGPYTGILSKTTMGTLIAGGLVRSTDGGRTWEPIDVSDDLWKPIGAILDYGSGRVLLHSVRDVGLRTIYESTDDGVTWSHIGDRPATGTHGASVVAPEGIGYVMEFKSVYVTADTGRTWDTRNVASEPQNWLTGLVIDRTGNPVTVSVQGQAFRSEDQGMSWTEVAALENVSFTSLFVDTDGVLFAGSSDGTVWRSHDNGTTWRPYATIPDAFAGAILSFAVGPDRLMYIGTEARGVWRVDMDRIGGIEGEVRVAERLDLR